MSTENRHMWNTGMCDSRQVCARWREKGVQVRLWGSGKVSGLRTHRALKGRSFLQGDEMGWAWHSKRKTLPAHKQDCSAGLENGVKAVSWGWKDGLDSRLMEALLEDVLKKMCNPTYRIGLPGRPKRGNGKGAGGSSSLRPGDNQTWDRERLTHPFSHPRVLPPSLLTQPPTPPPTTRSQPTR